MQGHHIREGDPQQFNEVHRFFEFSLDLFAISGFDGYIKRVNPAWERTLGYTPEELFSKPAIEFVHPDDRLASFAQGRQIRAGVSVLNFSNRYICKDGSIKWLEWTGHPYPEEGLIYIVGRDVTNRKQAENALRESEARFRNMADTAPVLVWMSGIDKACNFFNQPWLEFRGRSMEAELGNGWTEGIHPDDHDRCLRVYSEAFDARLPFEMEYRLQRADGSYRWIIDTGVPRFENDHEFVGYIGSCIDIHDRKLNENALRESEQAVRGLLNGLPNHGLLTKIDGTILALNQGQAAIFHKTIDEMVGKNINDFVPDDEIVRTRRTSAEIAIKEGKTLSSTTERNGHILETTISPIVDSDGNAYAVVISSNDITHIKQTEAALRQNERTLREFVNAMPGEIVVTDLDGQLISFNEAFATRYQRPGVKLADQNIYNLLSPVNAQRRKPYTQVVIESGKPMRFESESRGHYFDVTIFPILDTENKVVRLGTYVQDVTELKQAVDAVRSSERTLRDLLNGSQDMAHLTDIEGKLIAYNRKFAELLGVSPDDGYKLNIYDILPPESLTLFKSIAQRVLSNREPIREEFEYGGQFFDYSVHPILNEAKEVISLATFSHEITHRKHMEQKLRASEARFRSVLESAAEGILLTDKTGAILLVNRKIEDLFGYSREELFGQSVDMLLPEAQRTIHIQHRGNFDAEPGVRPMGIGLEVFGHGKDGNEFPIEVSLSYIQGDEGMLVIAFVANITERKQIEQERLDHQRVHVELEQERQFIELRQRFMSMVSHEFRTPLTVIGSSTELLQRYYDRLPKDKQMEKLYLINGQVRLMVSLLDDVLALDKIQAGAAEFAPDNLDLVSLCDRILENIELIDQGKHHFVFTHEQMPSLIEGDRRLLEHIVNNLMSNAVKYSPPESTVTLSLKGTLDVVQIDVRDEGIGIPLEAQEHMFESFYRAPNARKINGTGLGLAIVKHNVERHHGTIRFESIEGQGTTFTVELPTTVDS